MKTIQSCPNDIDSGCNCFSSQLYDRVIYYTELHEDKNRKGKGAQIMLTLFWLKFIPKFRDGLRYLMIFWSLKTLTTPQFRLQKFNLISTPENAHFHQLFINGAAPSFFLWRRPSRSPVRRGSISTKFVYHFFYPSDQNELYHPPLHTRYEIL